MQKIKKFNLIVVLIVFFISAITAVILFKTGIAKIKLANSLDMFDLIMIGLAALVWAFSLADFYKIKKDKNKVGEIKFNVSIKINKLFTLSSFLLLFLSICQIALFVIEGKASSLAFAMVLIPTSCTNLLRNKANNTICENGIYYWGIYHPWNKVKAYEIDENTLNLKVEVRPFGIRSINPIKFFFDINDCDNISELLNSKINN